MIALQTVIVAFSMFSALPMPQIDWNEDNMRYSMCAFPLIGVVIGGACWAWAALCGALSLPPVLRGAGLCLIPVWLTGGIHLDGFADTWDALSSHAPAEKKREILKDPRLGCFAAIHLCSWFLAVFALWTALPRFPGPAVLLGFCLSRTLSGLAVVSFPMAGSTGLGHMFAASADQKRVRRVLLALAVLLGGALCTFGAQGIAMTAAALAVLCYYKSMAQKQFGGLSGDLAGWFLQTAELWMLAALCGVQLLEGLR